MGVKNAYEQLNACGCVSSGLAWLRAGGNSLDNTIRIIRLVETEWVLGEIHVHGIGNGFGHGRIHLWSQRGELLATASQSVIVRKMSELPKV